MKLSSSYIRRLFRVNYAILLLIIHHSHVTQTFSITRVDGQNEFRDMAEEASNLEMTTATIVDKEITTDDTRQTLQVEPIHDNLNKTFEDNTEIKDGNTVKEDTTFITLTSKFAVNTDNGEMTTNIAYTATDMTNVSSNEETNQTITPTSEIPEIVTSNLSNETNTVEDNMTTSYSTLTVQKIVSDNNYIKNKEEATTEMKTTKELPIIKMRNENSVITDNDTIIESIDDHNQTASKGSNIFMENRVNDEVTTVDLPTIVNIDDIFLPTLTNFSINEENESQKPSETKNDVLANKNGMTMESQRQPVKDKDNDHQFKENSTIKADIVDTENIYFDSILSVKPINSESKVKNISLYSVNDKYKRLKKLEIVQPKSNKRDPNDNSWRNESISSLGIVFNANNSSKPLTLVLKNKTETEFNIGVDKNDKDDKIELRDRLEKLSEKRKYKKKKPGDEDKMEDYEDDNIHDEVSTAKNFEFELIEKNAYTTSSTIPQYYKEEVKTQTTTEKAKQMLNFFDEFERMFNEEKMNLMPYMEVKKSNKPNYITKEPATTPGSYVYTAERKPTVQYFPPRSKPKANNHETNYQKNNPFTPMVPMVPMINDNYPTKHRLVQSNNDYRNEYNNNQPLPPRMGQQNNFMKELEYVDPRESKNGFSIVNNERNFHRDSYAINHMGNLRRPDLYSHPYVDVGIKKIPINYNNHRNNHYPPKNIPVKDDYDVEVPYHKEPFFKFRDNYNPQKYEFNIDYPLTYNNTILHRVMHGPGDIAAPSKRIYEERPFRQEFNIRERPCYPNCEKYGPDMPPDYELQYYIPEEEEKQVMQHRSPEMNYRPAQFRYYNNPIHPIRVYRREGL